VAATETTEELSDEEQKAKDKLEQSEKDLDSASVYHNKKTTFVVRSGLLSSSVAREMEEAGVIDDADAFDEFLEKNGYGKQVRSGTYKIPKDADYETIAKIITRQD
jgi:cell division protein YceG involved in septum cleavage